MKRKYPVLKFSQGRLDPLQGGILLISQDRIKPADKLPDAPDKKKPGGNLTAPLVGGGTRFYFIAEIPVPHHEGVRMYQKPLLTARRTAAVPGCALYPAGEPPGQFQGT
jgi:hypothetical protein